MEEPTIKKQVGRYMLHAESLSRAQLFVIPWILACQAPPSMGFSRQGYWSGLLFPSPGDLADPGIELMSPEAPVSEKDSFYH